MWSIHFAQQPQFASLYTTAVMAASFCTPRAVSPGSAAEVVAGPDAWGIGAMATVPAELPALSVVSRSADDPAQAASARIAAGIQRRRDDVIRSDP
jgi:hypothetical protein